MLRVLVWLTGLLLAVLSPEPALSANERQFVGTWHLSSWTRSVGDLVQHPYGEDAKGMIVYTSDGMMTGALMASTRDPNLLAGGYLSYSGAYEVDLDEKTVSHHVEMASIPDWLGTVLVRAFEFETPDVLILSLEDEGGGHHALRWVRRTQ